MQKNKTKIRKGLRDFFIATDETSDGKLKSHITGLRRYIDKIKPNFMEGGRFSKLQSTFEAFESFLFVPDETTKCGVQIRDAVDMKRTMFFVVIALIPTLLFGIWNVGYQHALSCGDGMPCMAEFYIGKATNEPAPIDTSKKDKEFYRRMREFGSLHHVFCSGAPIAQYSPSLFLLC